MAEADPVAEAVRRADRDRYLAALYAPESKRGALLALYAFNAEIAAVRDRIREPLPGEMRLQWWRDVLAAGTQDAASGHPIAAALAGAIDDHGLPAAAFESYLEARVFDLYNDPMPSRTDLEGYCGETASALIQLSALILDPEAAPAAAEAAGHAGCAQAIAGLIRLLPRHRAQGQCYVPRDLLAAAGSTPEEFLSAGGGHSAAAVIAAMVALAREHLSAFERRAGALPASIRPAFLPLALTPTYLERVSQAGVGVLQETPALPDWRRHWLMFRRASRGWP